MRSFSLFVLTACLLAASSGCHTCGDRPRLFERLFHNDRDDCPSRSGRDGASAIKPSSDLASRGGCGEMPGSAMVPTGYAQMHSTPVSGSMPLYAAGPFSSFPTAVGPAFNPSVRDNELPMPVPGGQRIPPTDMPLGPLAPASPANPNNVSVPAPGNPGRFTAEPRK